jgi:hypothetical protein
MTHRARRVVGVGVGYPVVVIESERFPVLLLEYLTRSIWRDCKI